MLSLFTKWQNFRLVQIESICRRKFHHCFFFSSAVQAFWKQCGKRRNCSKQAISPFLTVFFYLFEEPFFHFCQIWNCRLRSLSVWKSLKFVVWEKVKFRAAADLFDRRHVLISLKIPLSTHFEQENSSLNGLSMILSYCLFLVMVANQLTFNYTCFTFVLFWNLISFCVLWLGTLWNGSIRQFVNS